MDVAGDNRLAQLGLLSREENLGLLGMEGKLGWARGSNLHISVPQNALDGVGFSKKDGGFLSLHLLRAMREMHMREKNLGRALRD